jgi:PAS domain S-box-containing protein
MAIAIILFSTMISAITTGMQFYGDYRLDIDSISKRLDEIGAVQVPTLANSVWAMDDAQTASQLGGLTRLPDIEHAAVRADGHVLASAGQHSSSRTIVRRYPLVRNQRGQEMEIGVLEVSASLDDVYSRLLGRLGVVLVTNGIKTFLIALFMLIIFQWLVTRHLYRLADYASAIDPTRPDSPDIVLDRRSARTRSKDALDMLSTTLNDMRRKLTSAYLAISESQQSYQQIFDNSPVGLFRATPDGRFLKANSALARLLGDASPEQTMARVSNIELQLFVDPNDRRRNIEALTRGSTIYDQEVRWRRADGRVIWVSLSARAVCEPDGRLIHSEGSVVDVSARVTAEEELRVAKEAAESANLAKSQFLANISHDLRTPLNAIIGFSEIIFLRLLGPTAYDKYFDRARDINHAGKYLLEMVDQLLDVSKIEAGKFELRLEDVELAAAVREAINLLSDEAVKKGVALALDPGGDDIRLRVDPLRLRQILVNLLSNAVKFTPSGGSARFGLFRDDRGGVNVRLSDTGIGISHANLARVATPFTRITDAYRRDNAGVGLGLWLARRLAELHGGNLSIDSVDSVEGKGTTVVVRFSSDVSFTPAHTGGH